jgi:hypothetical protein
MLPYCRIETNLRESSTFHHRDACVLIPAAETGEAAINGVMQPIPEVIVMKCRGFTSAGRCRARISAKGSRTSREGRRFLVADSVPG